MWHILVKDLRVLEKNMGFVLIGWSSICVLCMLSHFSPVQLCDPMDCSPPDSSLHGILQSRILEWVAMPSSRESFWPRDWTHISCIGRWFFTNEPPGNPEEITNPPLPHWKTDRQTDTHTHRHTHTLGSYIKALNVASALEDIYCTSQDWLYLLLAHN